MSLVSGSLQSLCGEIDWIEEQIKPVTLNLGLELPFNPVVSPGYQLLSIIFLHFAGDAQENTPIIYRT